MKRAKQRPFPTLDKLASSIKQTDRALSETLAFCAASNKRIAKKEKRAAVKALEKFIMHGQAGVGAGVDLKALISEGRAGEEAPTPRKKCKLKDLLDQIPPGTKFEEIDFGPPVGKEII